MIHRTRQGFAPSGGAETGRDVVQIGDIYVEYSGAAPTQAVLNAYFAPPDPADTDPTPDDIVRALITKGLVTPSDIANAKRNR